MILPIYKRTNGGFGASVGYAGETMDEELRNALASDYFVSLTNEVGLWRLRFCVEKRRTNATAELIDGDLDNLFARWIDFERKISEGANE